MSKNNRYNREFKNREEKTEEAVKVKDEPTEELKEEKEEVVEETEVPPTRNPKKGHVTAQLLNVRTDPQKGENIIGQLPKGTSVDIIVEAEGWLFIKGEVTKGVSVSGYVMSEYIKED